MNILEHSQEPEVVYAQLGPGVVAGPAVVPCAVAAVARLYTPEAGAATGPDLLTDEAVGDAQHGDREEEEGQAEVDRVVRVGQPGREHGRASLNVGHNSWRQNSVIFGLLEFINLFFTKYLRKLNANRYFITSYIKF